MLTQSCIDNKWLKREEEDEIGMESNTFSREKDMLMVLMVKDDYNNNG